MSPHGWKTYLAAGAAIIGGLATIVNANHYQEGFTMIVGGLALIGVRGSVARVIEVLQAILAKRG